MQPSGVTEVFNTQSQCVRETKKILEQNSADQPELKIENIEVDGDTAMVDPGQRRRRRADRPWSRKAASGTCRSSSDAGTRPFRDDR